MVSQVSRARPGAPKLVGARVSGPPIAHSTLAAPSVAPSEYSTAFWCVSRVFLRRVISAEFAPLICAKILTPARERIPVRSARRRCAGMTRHSVFALQAAQKIGVRAFWMFEIATPSTLPPSTGETWMHKGSAAQLWAQRMSMQTSRCRGSARNQRWRAACRGRWCCKAAYRKEVQTVVNPAQQEKIR